MTSLHGFLIMSLAYLYYHFTYDFIGLLVTSLIYRLIFVHAYYNRFCSVQKDQAMITVCGV